MKNFTVRAFVLVLALTGAAAASVSSSAKSPKQTAAFTEPSAPAPVCPINSTNSCGIQ